MTTDLSMTGAIGEAEQEKSTEWLKSPALTAVHLSRGRWLPYDHLKYISNEIIQMEEHPIFLIINFPPRHGKSELISHWTPVWFLKRYPYKHIILASYESSFAAEWGGIAKNSIEENKEELDIELTRDTKAKAHWKIQGYGGGMLATGISGPITGRGGDIIIIDDPIKGAAEANSPTYREALWTWYRANCRTRLQPGGSIIILMTRWHEDDLVGRLLSPDYRSENPEIADPWKVINLPALATEDDLLGRDPGDPLCPQMFDLSMLRTLRESIGPYWWDAEYMGNPRKEGGTIFKESWFQFITDNEIKNEQIRRTIQFWDTAFTEKTRNSRSACVTIAETKNKYIILDVYAQHIDYPKLIQVAPAKYEQYGVDRVLVEDKATGIPLVQQMKRDTRLPVKAIPAKDSKEVRAHSVSGVVEAERVYLRAGAPWVNEFLSEVCSFPTAVYDDITDAFVHGLRYLKPRRTHLGRSSVGYEQKQSIWKV